jgi:hypothetical protein
LTASGRDANFAAPWKERIAVRLSLPKIRLVIRSGHRRVGCNPSGDFILEATLVSVQEIILALADAFIVASAGPQVKSATVVNRKPEPPALTSVHGSRFLAA